MAVSEVVIEDLGLAAKLIPWFLSWKQKKFRAAVFKDLFQTTNNDLHFFKHSQNWRWIMDLSVMTLPWNETPVITYPVNKVEGKFVNHTNLYLHFMASGKVIFNMPSVNRHHLYVSTTVVTKIMIGI